VTVGDGVGRAGLDTVAAEDAPVVIDVVDLGVALGAGDAFFFGILSGFNVDTVRGTGGSAEEARDTFFKAIFVALELMFTAKALLKFGSAHGALAVRVVFDFGRLEHLLEGDAHSLGNGGCVFGDRHTLSIRRRRDRLKAMKTAAVSFSCAIALCFTAMGPAYPQTAPKPATAAPMEHAHAPAQPSTSLTLVIDGKSTTLMVAELEAMPQTTVVVHNEHTKVDESYTGVLLGSLLAKYGLPVDKETHRTMLRSYLVAEGSDKYWVLYSVIEIEFSEHQANVIVATSMGGKPLGEDGQLKLIDSADKKPQRWVRNLTTITVKTLE
jgi:hypothetical protein